MAGRASGLYTLFGILFNFLLQAEYFGKLNNPGLSSAMLLAANMFTRCCRIYVSLRAFQSRRSFGLLQPFRALLSNSLPFIITFRIFASIPPPIYKLWYYKPDSDEPDFDDIDLNNIYLLELEFSKHHDDANLKNYKARAPIDMIFGEWFGSFVKNYNYKFEEEPIEYHGSV